MTEEITKFDNDIDIEISDMMPLVIVAMMATMVSLLNTMLAPIAQQLQAQAYIGLTNTFVLNATPAMQWINLISNPPYTPLITASFFNDGPNSVFIGINNPDELLELERGDSRHVSMSGGSRRIELIFYKTGPGGRARVRVDGKY